jgi:transposase-like protein
MHGVDGDDPFVIRIQGEYSWVWSAVDVPDRATPGHIRLTRQHEYV